MISVILPTRNRCELLSVQLEALAAQTYTGAWELVVADNGSTDGTREFLGTLGDRFPRLTVVVADRGTGAAYARNRGVEASRGEYLLFVDDDDRVSPTWLESMAIAAGQWDAISGNTVEFRRRRGSRGRGAGACG